MLPRIRFEAAAVAGLIALAPGVLIAQQPDTVAHPDTVSHRDTLELSGNVTFGARDITGDHASSKFVEYRDLPRGMYLENFRLRWERAGSPVYVEGEGRRALQQDASYRLEAGNTGRYRFDLTWDQTPHVFSNTGQSLFSGVGGAVLRLPDALQSLEQGGTNPAGDLQSFLGAAAGTSLRLRRDHGVATLRYQVNPGWRVQVGYSIEETDGVRPLGTVIGPSPGAAGTVAELPQPLSYRTQQLEATLQHTARRWSMEIGYQGSLFHNSEPGLVWDNPLRLTDSAGGAPSGPTQGRVALAPDNTAHSVHATGALNAPVLDSRLVATVAFTAMRQNEVFLPHTINSAITDPGLALPQASLDGKVNALQLSTVYSGRLLRTLGVTARYRLYDMDNQTPQLLFPAHVTNDAVLDAEERMNLPYGYRRQTGAAGVSWHPVDLVSLHGSLEWEQWRRDFREVSRSNESTRKVTLDLTPIDWASVRASYSHGHRRPKDYDPTAPLAGLPGDTTLAQLALLRKFDEADRQRDRIALSSQLDPLPQLSLSADFGRTNDDYKQTVYGLQRQHYWEASASAMYAVGERLSLSADYVHEIADAHMTARQRRPGVPDSSLNDWTSGWKDKEDTYGLGLEWVVDARHDISVSASYNLALSSEQIHTAKADAASTLVTTAVDYPTVHTRLHWLSASVRYGLAANLQAVLQYRHERYIEDDFANDIMAPYMGNLNGSGAALDMFLGARYGGYDANILAVFLSWSPLHSANRGP